MDSLNTLWNIFYENRDSFITGIVNTVLISLIGTAVGLIIGMIFSVIKTKHKKNIFTKTLEFLINIYVNVFRGTPMIVQSMVIFYGFKIVSGVELPRLFAAFVIVSINTGAYLTEVVRGGMLAVSKGQSEAAFAIGLTNSQTMIHIVLPQALRNSLPAIGNEFITNIKDTAVLSVISVSELFFQSRTIWQQNYLYFQTAFVTCIIYLILTVVISLIIYGIEKKLDYKVRRS